MIINGSHCGKAKPLGKLDFLHFPFLPSCRASCNIVYTLFATHRAEKIQQDQEGGSISYWRPAEQDTRGIDQGQSMRVEPGQGLHGC